MATFTINPPTLFSFVLHLRMFGMFLPPVLCSIVRCLVRLLIRVLLRTVSILGCRCRVRLAPVLRSRLGLIREVF